MTLQLINPDGLPMPPTYTHVIVAAGSKVVFIDTLVGVEALARRGYLIEVDAIAVTGD
jgi:hypothetical protein